MFKYSAVSIFESRSLNVTNRKAFFLSMLAAWFVTKSGLLCYKIWAMWDMVRGRVGMSTAQMPCQWQSNESAHSQLLSRKQMPGREQLNLGKDICRFEQVEAWGQPEGLKKLQGKILWKSQVTTLVGLSGTDYFDKNCLCFWRDRHFRRS